MYIYTQELLDQRRRALHSLGVVTVPSLTHSLSLSLSLSRTVQSLGLVPSLSLTLTHTLSLSAERCGPCYERSSLM